MDILEKLPIDKKAVSDFLHDKFGLTLDFVKTHPWASLGIATGTVVIWSYIRTPRNLPPGPPGYPIIGAKSCLGPDLPKKMLEWRKTYGEIISFYSYGQLNIILNSERIIKEAYLKQADDFSARGEGATLLISAGIQDEIFTAPFNATWKKNKKFALTTLKSYGFGTAKSEDKFHEQINFLEEFILKEEGQAVDVYERLKLISAGAMSTIILGTDGSREDAKAKEIVRLTSVWHAALNDAYMTNKSYTDWFIPARIADILSSKVNANLQKISAEFTSFLSDTMKANAGNLEARGAESVTDAYMKERGITDEVISTVAKTIIVFLPDAIDTAPILISWCLLYITLYADAQKKIRHEVTKVIGTGRLPRLSDRGEMPFTEAVIYEVLRLCLIAPLSLQRELQRDVKLDGFTLPRGAIIKGNFYGVHFDPEVFPEPFDFKPARFLKSDGKLDTGLAGRLLSFSIGNRKCIGENYFRSLAFFFITRIVQRFEISFDPTAPTPTMENDETFFFAKPQPYKVCFKTI